VFSLWSDPRLYTELQDNLSIYIKLVIYEDETVAPKAWRYWMLEEHVYRVVSSGTCVESRCTGKVLTELLLARGVRKPARATPGLSASIHIY
jgi:hypothetical protein